MSKPVKIGVLEVSFKKGILPDGELEVIRLKLYENEIPLTKIQARALAKRILEKFGSE